VTKMLIDNGFSGTGSDKEDWRGAESKAIPFVKAEIDSNDVDLFGHKRYHFAFSYNTFEHIPSPEKALTNIHQLLENDGLLFLSFGPLYNSAWSLHAYRMIHMPFPQFLFSSDT